MINVARVLSNPHFCQNFTVYRKGGHWDLEGHGRWVQTETSLVYSGVVTVTDAETLEQIPEGDRTSGMMTFHTKQELYKTRVDDTDKGTSDELLWRKERYKVIKTWPYMDYGYCKAVAVKMSGSR